MCLDSISWQRVGVALAAKMALARHPSGVGSGVADGMDNGALGSIRANGATDGLIGRYGRYGFCSVFGLLTVTWNIPKTSVF